jgi:acyl carrier protein
VGGVDDIESRVLEIFAQQIDCSSNVLLPEDRLVQRLGMDEFQITMLRMRLETEFGIYIPGFMFKPVKTIRDAVNVVKHVRQ